MTVPDTRETLDPAWEALAKKRGELVWNVHYCTVYAPQHEQAARDALALWDAQHAEEWNRLKPWYEVRI